jgi:hypothetical protein
MVVKLLSLVLLLCSFCFVSIAQELPGAPVPQISVEHPKFFDGWQQGKDHIRTNKQTMKSPWFWAPEMMMYSAVIIDVKINQGLPATRGLSGKEMYLDALLPAVACTGMHYVADRWVWRPVGLGLVGYFIVRHTNGAARQVYP